MIVDLLLKQNTMENKVYRKRIDWMAIGCMFAFMAMMAGGLLFPDGSYWGTVTALAFICLSVLVICLNIFGVLFYQLTLSEDCIIDKKIFQKKEIYSWSEIHKVVLSLDNNTIDVCGDQICLTLRMMKNSDQLLNDLCEKVGRENLEIGIK